MKYALVLLVASVCAFGQTTYGTQYPTGTLPSVPLKCGKYGHVDDTIQRMCAVLEPEHRNRVEACISAVTFCAPDMHIVTEEEWQALMARMRALEEATKCLGKPCFTTGTSGKEQP